MHNVQLSSLHLEQLKQACQALGLKPTENQQKQILEYLTQLLKWNKTYNLTAVRDVDQALIHHIFDSLSIVPILMRHINLLEIKNIKLLDVGSGAGLPGIVIAIMLPNAKVTCVDTVEKKMTFVRQMASVLRLDNVEAIHARVENLTSNEFDIITSRAFASLKDFASLAGRLVSKNGYLIAMKGKEPKEEIEEVELKTDWQVHAMQSLTVPQLDAQRCLVWMNQKGTQ